jgi:CHAT domain-containing protein
VRNVAPLRWAKPEYRTQRSLIPPRLESLLDRLITEERNDLAFRVAKIYINMHAGPSPLFERLLGMTTLRPEHKGNIYLELARKTTDYALSDDYLAKAEVEFQLCNHGIGTMEAQFIVLSRPHQDPKDVTDQLVSLVYRFYAMRYRAHTLLALRALGRFGGDAHHNIERRGPSLLFEEKLRRVAYEIGSKFFWTLAHLVFVSLLGLGNPQAAINIVENENILNPKMMIPIPQEKFDLCQTISRLYFGIGNRPMEAHWAALSMRFARESGQRELISMATSRYVQAMAAITVPEEDRAENDRRLRAVWLLAIDKAGNEFLIEEQFNLYWGLIQVRGRCLPNDLDDVLEKAQVLAEMLAESGNSAYLAKIAEMRGDTAVGVNGFERAMDYYKRASEIETNLGLRIKLSFTFFKIGLNEMALWDYKRVKDGVMDADHLISALENFTSAITMFQDQGNWDQIATSYYYKGVVWSYHLEYVDASSKDIANECLGCFAEAFFIRQRIRSEVTAGPKSMRNKQLLRSNDSQISDKAIKLCFNQGRYDLAWNWIQMSKGRTLSDMLAVGFIIPGYLREKIGSTEEMAQLLAQKTALTERLVKPGENSFAIRQDLESLRNQMNEFPPLVELLSLREGQSENLQSLKWLFSVEEQATLVDWTCIDQRVYIIVVDKELNPKMEEIKNEIDLHEWVEDYVSDDKTHIKRPSDAASPLRKIDHLVKPLERLTKPGGILVLSPSGPLHSIPLHALQLSSKQILIERNPVVYTANMSVLHQCMLRSTLDRQKEDFVAMGFYPEDDSEDEQKNVTENNVKIAGKFAGISLSGEDVTEIAFKEYAEEAAIIHFHGHAVPDDAGNILGQYLKLFIPEDDSQTEQTALTPPLSKTVVDYLDIEEVPYVPPGFSVRDIFLLKLKAPLVTLMACESARQEVSPGDDPMGLVSAFLISGASSVLGTLWSVLSRDGRVFADIFYQEIHRQCAEKPTSGMMDLALATQRAVLKIRENPDTRAAYHWAEFVLHGTWRMKAFNVKT